MKCDLSFFSCEGEKQERKEEVFLPFKLQTSFHRERRTVRKTQSEGEKKCSTLDGSFSFLLNEHERLRSECDTS